MAEEIRNNQPQATEEVNIGDILRVRREKLAALREAGADPFQITKYPQDTYSAEIKERFADLEAEAETDVEVCLAGRMMTKRVMGKASFAHLRDDKGDIQIYVRRDVIGDESYAGFKKMDIGDIIGVEGFGQHTHILSLTLCFEDFLLAYSLSAEDLGLFICFRTKNLGFLFTLCNKDCGLLFTLSLKDFFTAFTLCLHLLLHRILNSCRRDDILKLNTVNFDSPRVCCNIK